MRNLLTAWFLFLSFLMPVAAACEATYDPAINYLFVPCVSVPGGATERYSIGFRQDASGTITVDDARQLNLSDTVIDDVQFISSPRPVVLVMYSLWHGCLSLYEPATMEWSADGRALTIQMRTVDHSGPAISCIQSVTTGTKAFQLSLGFTPGVDTMFTVTVNNVTKAFSYNPSN